MVESGAQELSEADMVQALTEGHAVIKQICALQKQLRQLVGKPKREVKKKVLDAGLAGRDRGGPGRAPPRGHAQDATSSRCTRA